VFFLLVIYLRAEVKARISVVQRLTIVLHRSGMLYKQNSNTQVTKSLRSLEVFQGIGTLYCHMDVVMLDSCALSSVLSRQPCDFDQESRLTLGYFHLFRSLVLTLVFCLWTKCLVGLLSPSYWVLVESRKIWMHEIMVITFFNLWVSRAKIRNILTCFEGFYEVFILFRLYNSNYMKRARNQ